MVEKQSEDNTTLFPPWKELLQGLPWEHGDVNKHPDIAIILGVVYGSAKYYQYMAIIQKKLKSQGKRIVVIPKVGYRVLMPNEYPRMACEDTHKTTNASKRGLLNAHYAPVQKMDHGTQRQIEMITASLAKAHSGLVNLLNESKAIADYNRPQKMLGKSANGKED